MKLLNQCAHADAAAVLIWDVTVLSDWLASGREEFAKIPESASLEEYARASRDAAQRALDNAGFDCGERLPAEDFAKIWPNLAGKPLSPLQSACVAMVKE